MGFTLLPAIDVAAGRVVRPAQAVSDRESDSLDPIEAALAWQADGAEWIHLVDLDAAFQRGSNAELLAGVIGELDIKVELSGGIDDDVSLERALASGCERVILGTSALQDLAWCAQSIRAYGERIAIALDVSVAERENGSMQHRLKARGGVGRGGDVWETLEQLDAMACARYIVTDVSRDGMLTGPNLELCRAVTSATAAPVIASGGVSTIADLVSLAEMAGAGANLEGSIVGKALYAGRFTLPQALEALQPVQATATGRRGD